MSLITRLLHAFFWLIPGYLTIASQSNMISEDDFGNAVLVEKTAIDMDKAQIEMWNSYLKQTTRVGQDIGEIDLMMKAFGVVGISCYLGGNGLSQRVYPIDEFVEIWVYCNDRSRAIIEIPFAMKRRHWRRFPDGFGCSEEVWVHESKPSESKPSESKPSESKPSESKPSE
jgi:hypothetical protein